MHNSFFPLPGISEIELFVYPVQNGTLVETPGRADEDGAGSISRKPVYRYVSGYDLKTADYRIHI